MFGQEDHARLLVTAESDSRADNGGIETGMPVQHIEQFPMYPPTASSFGPSHAARLDPSEAVPFTWAEVSENHFDHHHQPYVYGKVKN